MCKSKGHVAGNDSHLSTSLAEYRPTGMIAPIACYELPPMVRWWGESASMKPLFAKTTLFKKEVEGTEAAL
jgi:hypothetical protein